MKPPIAGRLLQLSLLGICAAFVLLLSPWSVFEIRAAPPPLIQLTNDPAIDVRPAWSPDNKLIAFQSNRGSSTYHVYVMNTDGSNVRALTKGPNDDRHPIWMPDGKALLFDSFDGKAAEIWMVTLADGSLKQLTHTGSNANFAAPSPNAQQMTYYIYDGQTLDLWTSKIDGSAPRQLTKQLASATNNQCTFACHNAAWSPDNATIAYSGGDHTSIWTMNADGSNTKKLISNEEHNHFPWYLPDGRLGYITEHVSPIASFTDAWAYDSKSSQAALLHEQMSPQGPFEWSNDGTKVLFHSPRAGNFDIYLIDLTAAGGVEALQGKSTEVFQAGPLTGPGVTPAAPRNGDPAVPAPAASPAPAAEAIAPQNSPLLWLAGGVIALLAIVGFAVVVVIRNRNSDI